MELRHSAEYNDSHVSPIPGNRGKSPRSIHKKDALTMDERGFIHSRLTDGLALTIRDIAVKPTVYIETSVINYRAARPSPDLIVAAHQQMTHEWWDRVLPQCDVFVSPVVLEEMAHGDPDAAQRRLRSIASFPVLEVVPEVHTLAAAYYAAIPLSDQAQADAYYLALAAWHGLDYLVSGNGTHVVSGRVRMIIEEVNAQFGIRTPIICTQKNLWRLPNGG